LGPLGVADASSQQRRQCGYAVNVKCRLTLASPGRGNLNMNAPSSAGELIEVASPLLHWLDEQEIGVREGGVELRSAGLDPYVDHGGRSDPELFRMSEHLSQASTRPLPAMASSAEPMLGESLGPPKARLPDRFSEPPDSGT